MRFSQEIESLLQELVGRKECLQHRPLTLQDVLAKTSERGFSVIISILVLPFLLPMPPGVAGAPAMACFLLSMQMAMGRTTPWLPAKIASFTFPHQVIVYLLSSLKKITRLLEWITRPRLPKVAENPLIWRVNGLFVAWSAFLLMLPIPLTNAIFTTQILLLTVATIESDGLLMCVGYGMTIATTFVFFVSISAILSSL
jgi:hypothetical protein